MWQAHSFSPRKKCPYSELIWSPFSRSRTEYGYLVRMRENADQNNCEYGHFSRNVLLFQKWNATLTFFGETKKFQRVVQLVWEFFWSVQWYIRTTKIKGDICNFAIRSLANISKASFVLFMLSGKVVSCLPCFNIIVKCSDLQKVL